MNNIRQFSSIAIIVCLLIVTAPVLQDNSEMIVSPTTSKGDASVSDESDAPTMEYYPRKYLGYGVYGNVSFTVIANDSDGVDTILLKYRKVITEDWNSKSMIRDETDETIFRGQLYFGDTHNFSNPIISYQVQYEANDTLNNARLSPLMEFGVNSLPVTSDANPQLYDTPDLWYLAGTTGHTLTWATVDAHVYPVHYFIEKDGFLLERFSWEQQVTINVDGLSLGDHNYRIGVFHGGWGSTDNITVHVVEELPTGVPTGSVWPNTTLTTSSEIDSALQIQVIATVVTIGIIAVGTILFVIKRNKQY